MDAAGFRSGFSGGAAVRRVSTAFPRTGVGVVAAEIAFRLATRLAFNVLVAATFARFFFRHAILWAFVDVCGCPGDIQTLGYVLAADPRLE